MATTPPQQPSSWVQDLLSRPARPYTLGPGETPAVLAERLGLTLVQLQTFNQLRTFSKPFAQLSTGDELDIPATDVKLSSQPSQSTPLDGQQKAADTQLAGQLTGLAGIAASDDAAAAAASAASAARSVVTGAANNAVEQWLGQYGTVQAQLSMNDDWRLEDSSIDWLVPFYETQDNLLFTQLGWRNKDDRNTVNLGLGMRWFTADSMYGLNGFYDADITGENRRLGLGLEYWRDYMTMSANGYFRLTDWHQSMDFADYDERPANGWDVQLNGWLPSYPQLGGKLVYEKYYGDDVALFGNDLEQRQKDPRAVTAGINWTPFPLLTLGLDHRIGDDGMNDTNINLQLTWKPDESWDSQVSSSEVAGMRLLSGTRHNLVDRNNDIILEYRKQVLIKATVSPTSVRDVPGSTHIATVQVNSKYPLQSVSWDVSSFLAAGGTLSQPDLQHAKLTLPPYQMPLTQTYGKVAPPSNFYVLTSTAVDSNGNRATPQEITVEVLPPNASLSGVSLEKDGAAANGVDTNIVKAKVTDANGAPVSGQTVNFTATNGAVVGTAAATDALGETSVTLTSTTAGLSAVTAEINGSSQTVDVNFVSVASTATSSLTAAPASIVANGTEASVVTLTLKDANNNAISGETVTFSSTLANSAFGGVTDNGDGTYTANLTGTTAGSAVVTANLNGSAFTVGSAVVTLTPDASTAQIAFGDLVMVSNNALADGTATNSVKAKVTDAKGNLLSGQTVTFTATNGAVVGSVAATDAAGETTATLTNITAGLSVVTASINGSNRITGATFADDGSDAQLSGNLVVVTNNAMANGTATNSVKAKVTDVNGTPLSGQTVTFTATNSAVVDTPTVTDVNGETTVTLTNTAVGVSTVTAEINGSSQSVNVTFKAGAVDATQSYFHPEPASIPADNTTLSKAYITLKDSAGNPVIDAKPTSYAVTTVSGSPAIWVGGFINLGDGRYSVDAKFAAPGEAKLLSVSLSGIGTIDLADVSIVGFDSAQIAPGGLSTVTDSAPATGTATNKVKVKVTNAAGIPVSGQAVNFTATNGAVVGTAAATDANGETSATLTSTTAGVSTVTAEISGSSTTVDVNFIADASTAQIASGDLVLLTSNAIANGAATNSVKAKVTDTKGNPLSGQTVAFTATNGAVVGTAVATDAAGETTVTLTSTTTGVSTVTAIINGSSQTVDTLFVVDNGIATIATGDLVIATDNSPANGRSANKVKALVTDANGNGVSGQTVSFTATNGAKVGAAALTDALGETSVTLTSTTAGLSAVTAEINGSSQTVEVTFIADPNSYVISNITVSGDNVPADGRSSFQVNITVKDVNGNVSNSGNISVTATNGAVVPSQVAPYSGSYNIYPSSTTAGVSTITATINGSSQSVDVNFVGDHKTAQISSGDLVMVTDNAQANGMATNSVKVKATDVNGNPVSGQAVTLTATNGARAGAAAVTDANGESTVTLTSTTVGVSSVIVSINSSSQLVDINFVADTGTGGIASGNLAMVMTGAIANGTATNSVKAKVTDASGNPISGQAITFTATNGAVVGTAAPTDAAGETLVTLTSTTVGMSKVTAEINGSSQSVNTFFIAAVASTTTSSLTASPAAIMANGNDASVLTLTLKDEANNAVRGETVSFTVTGVTGTTVGPVTGNGDGTYTANLTGTVAGTAQVSATVAGSAFGVTAVPVTLVTPLPSSTQFKVNGHTFTADSGFPTTGFANAKFQILMEGTASNNGNYTWSSNQPWVSVDSNGNVVFTGTATSATKTVIITAVPTGGGESLTWRFTVNKWFAEGIEGQSGGTASTHTCNPYGGLPSVAELTNGGKYGGSPSRQLGSLWSEWGSMGSYPGNGRTVGNNWSNEKVDGSANMYFVNMTTGISGSAASSGLYLSATCRQSL